MASGESLKIDVEETIHRSTKKHKLDTIVGHIEDIIISDEFQDMQEAFMEKYYNEFNESEENKLVYTDIFREYNEVIERYLNCALTARITKFSMEKFCVTLKEHEKEISGDIFDMLLSFSDFLSFKEMFLNYKAEKEGKYQELNQGLVVTPLQSSSQNLSIGSNLNAIEHGIQNLTTNKGNYQR